MRFLKIYKQVMKEYDNEELAVLVVAMRAIQFSNDSPNEILVKKQKRAGWASKKKLVKLAKSISDVWTLFEINSSFDEYVTIKGLLSTMYHEDF